MAEMEQEDSPIEPSSLEYIEDSYVPNLEHNATPSLDDLCDDDFDECDDLDDIYNGENVTWSKETDMFLRSLTLDQILHVPDDDLSVIDENIEMQTVEFSHIENSPQPISRNFFESTKNKWRLLTRRKMRDIRVTFIDLSKPYILKISSSDNYKKFLSIGGTFFDYSTFNNWKKELTWIFAI